MTRNLLICVVVALVCVSCGTMASVSSNPSSAPNPPTPPVTGESFTVTTATLPSATASVGYRTSVTASGGTAPYTWTVASGNLPPGLILDEAQGVITGIPDPAETASFEIQAADSAGQTAVKPYTLTVGAGSWGTTYYVDVASGQDSNAGSSSSAPWRTITKVNASKFAPGDRILLKSGDLWREQMQLASSGAPGSPILIGSYGSGAPPIISGADLVPSGGWTTCTNCVANVWQAPVEIQPNVVFFNGNKGQAASSLAQLTGATQWYWSYGKLYVWSSSNPGSAYSGPGIEAGSRQLGIGFFGISYVSVENLQFVGVNGPPTNGAVYAQAFAATSESSHDLDFNRLTVLNSAADGIHLEDCNNCIVENSTISGMARAGIMMVSNQPQFPVTAGATIGNTVFGNHFDGISTYGCAVGGQCEGATLPAGEFFSGLIISRNTVHDNGAGVYLHWTNKSSVTANSSYGNTDPSAKGEGYGVGMEASSGNIVQKNLLYANRTRGIELSNDEGAGTGLTGSSNNVVQYNAIHDNGDHGIFTNAAPTQSNHFLYNVIWNHPNGECFAANGTGHEFFGNTCWNSSTGVDLYTSSSTPTTANISIKNNVFGKNVIRSVHIESGVSISTLIFDHNDYDGVIVFLLPTTTADWSAWQAMGFDIHSLADNPTFVTASPITPSDFVLETSSPLATSGMDLGPSFATGLAPVSSWPANVQTAAQGAGWSIGAFPQKR